jgi:hypothetical protein
MFFKDVSEAFREYHPANLDLTSWHFLLIVFIILLGVIFIVRFSPYCVFDFMLTWLMGAVAVGALSYFLMTDSLAKTGSVDGIVNYTTAQCTNNILYASWIGVRTAFFILFGLEMLRKGS